MKKSSHITAPQALLGTDIISTNGAGDISKKAKAFEIPVNKEQFIGANCNLISSVSWLDFDNVITDAVNDAVMTYWITTT